MTDRGSRVRQLLVWMALVAVVVVAGAPTTGALPGDGFEPPEIDPGTFTPPANGFGWSVANRFALQPVPARLPDFHWSSHERPIPGVPVNTYDPAYVHPGTLRVSFDGCPTEAEATAPTNTYTWQRVVGTALTSLLSAANCQPTFQLPIDPTTGMATHTIRLTIVDPGGNVSGPFEQQVALRDYLIVSLGDSYGSGEGNPDIPQTFTSLGFVDQPPEWIDRRCHRSAQAAAAVAARSIEIEPTSSVTFLSFACSGATLDSDAFADEGIIDAYEPYIEPSARTTPSPAVQNVGAGVLAPYRGSEPPNSTDFTAASRLPSQVQQLVNAVSGPNGVKRRVDAMVISTGGNDMGFARIAATCVVFINCKDHQVSGLNGGQVSLDTRVQQDIGGLTARYDSLASRLNQLKASGDLDINKLYITEYPDSTKDDNGTACSAIVDDIIPSTWALLLLYPPLQPLLALGVLGLPFAINNDPLHGREVDWAAGILPPLNAAVTGAATRHASDAVPWRAITGIAADFQSDASGRGHGYCADDPWIRTAAESNVLQGPFSNLSNKDTKGTLHPNTAGHRSMARRIDQTLRADLLPPTPTSGPAFFASDTASTGNTVAQPLGTTSQTSVAGANGWLTGTCPGTGGCGSPTAQVVSQVVATTSGAASIRGVDVKLNGAPVNCAAPPSGVTCTATSISPQLFKWAFSFSRDGVYRADFSVSTSNRAIGRHTREIKVDLRDPPAPTVALTSAVAPTSGWYRAPVAVTFDGEDAPGGSGLQAIDYRLDGQPTRRATDGEVLNLQTEGQHTIAFEAVDWAGRKSATQLAVVRIDRTPPVVSISSPTPTRYSLGQSVAGTVVCTDALSGVAACTHPATADTSTVGTKIFTASAADVAGNTATASVTYQVSFALCLLYDSTKSYRVASVVPIRLRLCQANGANVSSTSIPLTATGLLPLSGPAVGAGRANPDGVFRYDAADGSYVFNLNTKGLSPGRWSLLFVAPGDSLVHQAPFELHA